MLQNSKVLLFLSLGMPLKFDVDAMLLFELIYRVDNIEEWVVGYFLPNHYHELVTLSNVGI